MTNNQLWTDERIENVAFQASLSTQAHSEAAFAAGLMMQMRDEYEADRQQADAAIAQQALIIEGMRRRIAALEHERDRQPIVDKGVQA